VRRTSRWRSALDAIGVEITSAGALGIDDRVGGSEACRVKSGGRQGGKGESDITRATRSRIVATLESLPRDSRSTLLSLYSDATVEADLLWTLGESIARIPRAWARRAIEAAVEEVFIRREASAT